LPVLLVEDNEVNYLVAMNMLDKLGCQVTYAMNGLQAIEKLKQQRFAVIFMDIHMPEMDGFEAKVMRNIVWRLVWTIISLNPSR